MRRLRRVRVSKPLSVDPIVNLKRVEADELADLEERHAVLGDEPADEPLGHAELDRQGGNFDESPPLGRWRVERPTVAPLFDW